MFCHQEKFASTNPEPQLFSPKSEKHTVIHQWKFPSKQFRHLFDLMLNRSYIIESQTAWVILSHKGYLEVNLTRNNYNKLKTLSAREEKKNIRNNFFKKMHYLWRMILIIFVLALLCPRRRFVTFRIIQQFFFSFYLRFSFSPLKSSNASMLITFQQHFFLFKHYKSTI